MSNLLDEVADGLKTRDSGTWALTKLDYLKRYIDMFSTSMRGKLQLNYVDLFAGPGKICVENREIRLGSPLLALTAQHPFNIYYLVENDAVNINALRQRCADSIYNQRVITYQDDCNTAVVDIVRQVRRTESNSLSLAFIDPEGLELKWETVARLASVKRMDLIINYQQFGFKRNIEKLYKMQKQTSIDTFFGTRDWRTVCANIWPTDLNVVENKLIDYYKERLSQLGYIYIDRGTEFGTEPLMRNTQNAPMYRLLFASKHELAYKFWREVTKRDINGQRQLPF